MYRPPDKPFLRQDIWNYIRVPGQVLTGSNSFRTVVFYATENTVVKYFDIFNNEDDAKNMQQGYVSATEGGAGIMMGMGWACDYKDFIHDVEFVVPAGYYLTLIGAASPTYGVGFALAYKGGLVQKSDEQSA